MAQVAAPPSVSTPSKTKTPKKQKKEDVGTLNLEALKKSAAEPIAATAWVDTLKTAILSPFKLLQDRGGETGSRQTRDAWAFSQAAWQE